jgi:hypothetical protein
MRMHVTFETNDDIRRHIEKSGHKFSVIHEAANGLPIYCVEMGGTKTPPIVITAGSHASEPAGVVGALRLLTELKSEHAVYVVPNRDPMGLEGYHRYLRFALGGEEPRFSTNTELAELLRQRGRILHDDANLVVASVGDFAFAAMEPSLGSFGPSKVWLKIKRLLSESGRLRGQLEGKYVVVPTNQPDSEGCGVFERAYTCFVTNDGELKNLNRLFGVGGAPPEIRAVQSLVDRVRPGLNLDLHEGFGDGFYLIVPPFDGNRPAEEIARAIVASMKEKQVNLLTLDQLKPQFPDGGVNMYDLGDGVLVEDVAKSDMQETMLAYSTAKYGPGFGVEVGRSASLERRGQLHVWAALAAIRMFEAQHR